MCVINVKNMCIVNVQIACVASVHIVCGTNYLGPKMWRTYIEPMF